MDPVFEEEQAHLSDTYAKLEHIEAEVRTLLEDSLAEALADKENLFDEMSLNLDADIQLETLAELEAMNRIIEGYNLSADINTEKLRRAQLLLHSPYFAKVRLQFPHADEPKDIYIGAAGMTDEKRRHFIVDWRSPVAEVYYNQANGQTSYEANGRTIEVELQLRRQFDIARDKLRAYFDTTVAIEDPLAPGIAFQTSHGSADSHHDHHPERAEPGHPPCRRARAARARHRGVGQDVGAAAAHRVPVLHRARHAGTARRVPDHAQRRVRALHRQRAARHGRVEPADSHVGWPDAALGPCRPRRFQGRLG